MRFDLKTRIKALEAGIWCGSDGSKRLLLREMHDSHLVNALLQALMQEAPAALTRLLAQEVTRRGLQDYAMDMAKDRT